MTLSPARLPRLPWGHPLSFDLRVAATAASWARVLMRRINLGCALASGEIQLAGVKTLLTRLDQYFTLPVVEQTAENRVSAGNGVLTLRTSIVLATFH